MNSMININKNKLKCDNCIVCHFKPPAAQTLIEAYWFYIHVVYCLHLKKKKNINKSTLDIIENDTFFFYWLCHSTTHCEININKWA